MMRILLLLLLSFSALVSHAVIDGHKYPFDNDVDRKRFSQLAEELRCPKCQNQNLSDSDAPVAADLRDKVYEMMNEGQNDEEIVDYLVARYGDFVRYNPPVQKNTFFLWFGPLVMVLIALVIIISITRSGKTAEPLSEEDKKRLADLKAAREKSNSSKATTTGSGKDNSQTDNSEQNN
jgi:cytochrome c-type biogenesis protein CcmH